MAKIPCPIEKMSLKVLRDFAREIKGVLYPHDNPDAEWTSNELEQIGWIMSHYGLIPPERTGPWHPEGNPHSVYDAGDWRYAVANGDTCLGYNEWVEHAIEANGP